MSWEQRWPLEGVIWRMGVEEQDWVVELKIESLEASAMGLPAVPTVSGGSLRRGVLRVKGWGWPVVLVMRQATWARTSRESHRRRPDKEKWQALPSPSPRPLKRVCPPLEILFLASPLCLSLAVFFPLLG